MLLSSPRNGPDIICPQMRATKPCIQLTLITGRPAPKRLNCCFPSINGLFSTKAERFSETIAGSGRIQREGGCVWVVFQETERGRVLRGSCVTSCGWTSDETPRNLKCASADASRSRMWLSRPNSLYGSNNPLK